MHRGRKGNTISSFSLVLKLDFVELHSPIPVSLLYPVTKISTLYSQFLCYSPFFPAERGRQAAISYNALLLPITCDKFAFFSSISHNRSIDLLCLNIWLFLQLLRFFKNLVFKLRFSDIKPHYARDTLNPIPAVVLENQDTLGVWG